MKKLAVVALIFSTIFFGCDSNAQRKQTKVEDNMNTKKILVAYFSASGNTAIVAKNLAQAADADLFEIVPEQKYTDADLDWTNKQSRSTLEMKNKKSRPAIKNKVDGMEKYEVIYVGFPIWWYTAPTIINTFLESYNLDNKTIIPFATSGGSDLKNVYKDLQPSAPKANFKQGKLLNGNPSIEELKSWIKSN